MTPIRVLVADDHPVVREGLVMLLGCQDGFEVVGEASDGEEAVARTIATSPDVVLLDLEMPRVDGIAALTRLRVDAPEVRVIVFTAFDTDERIFAAVRAGAKGYLLKGAPRGELFDAIRAVYAGETLLQPLVASKLLARVSEEASRAPVETLTPREQEVLGYLAKGLQNGEIARQLGIRERTVKFHVSSILTKLDVTNRTEAVAVAGRLGLVEL